ncbi:MAG: SMP-30/gluconolactonase/LRE family protein [Planctomycetia bacterium]|nr:SMP-30/gluconolactonase/LRE family protein [Planctomycetia bacterium]
MLFRLRSYAFSLLLLASSGTAHAAEALWIATPLTPENGFTTGIEGPGCDAAGNIYAVNFEKQGTIGRTTPDGKTEIFVQLPQLGPKKTQSVGNGIVFDRAGMMYVADYVNHNVLRVDPKTREVTVFGHDDSFSQPNDVAIGPDDVIFCADPNWGTSAGQIFRVDRSGTITRVAEKQGTTNGIEVSPDGKWLYTNESVQRGVWAFPISADGKLGERKLVKQFEGFGFDGMRCDVDGNLYVTRHGKGTVVVLSPQGEVLHEVDVLGKSPSNICFGGPDGRTAYVTEVEHRRLVSFRTDRPGLAWQRWQESKK